MGDVPNVVFPCATLTDAATGRISIYYGCADTVTAGADFGGLPGGLVSLHGTHYMAVAAPEFHIRALADEHDNSL